MNGSYDKDKKRKQMDAALDEVLMGNRATLCSKTNNEEFLPSTTWKGPKAGYYFGTSTKGTGYYWDAHQQKGGEEPTDKKKRKRITIDEGRNEIKSIPARMTAQELLEQAEQENRKRVELSDRGIRAAHAQLRKWTEKNALERAEHFDHPEEYMESELTLHQQLESYAGFATQSLELLTIPTEEFQTPWLEILAHPNMDIVTTACRVITEWLDEDEDSESSSIRFKIAQRLVQASTTSSILELLVSNLGRLQPNWEEDEEHQKGIEDILILLENLLELDIQQQFEEKQLLKNSTLAVWLVKRTTILSWLVQQLPSQHGPSVQVLALLLQQTDIYDEVADWTKLPPYSSLLIDEEEETRSNGKTKKTKPNIDCIELLLQAMAVFRKRQPSTSYELEFLENVILCLASLLTFSSGAETQKQFLQAQGLELVLRCLREKVHAGGIGLGLLETNHRPTCEHFISNLQGLKQIFPIFMQRSFPKPALLSSDKTKHQKKKKAHWMQKLEQHIIAILYHLTQHITADSPDDCLERLVCKFLENDCEKLDRLIQLLLKYDHKARRAEYNYYRFQESDDDAENPYNVLAAKLEGGGTHFQYCAVICAFCATHSKAAHTHILETLQLHQSGISLVKMALDEMLQQADEDHPQAHMWQNYLKQL